MPLKLHSLVPLNIARDVEIKDKYFLALSDSPWLRVGFGGAPPAGCWIRLAYAASLLDPLERPVLRCVMGNSYHDEILTGALFGRAVWLGFIPEGTEEIWVSPTNRAGPFSFAIESITVVPHLKAIWQCLRKNPRLGLMGIAAQLAGLRDAAQIVFRRAASPTRFEDYDEWRKLQSRDLDLATLDAPRSDWETGPHLRFVTTVEPAGPEALLRLASGLQAQPYPHWTIAAVSSPEIAQTFKPVAGALGKQIITMWPGAAASDVAKDLSDDDFIVPVAAGDLVPAYAVAALAEAVKQYPGTDIFYGDEEFIDGKGRHTAPQLRPDWSPVLCSALPESPLGATIFIRAQTLRRFAPGLAAASLVQAPYAAARSAICQQASVSHIRRVMRTRAGTPAAQSSCRRKPLAKGASSIAGRAVPPCATIIIPTRDRFDLLESCVESLRRNRLPHDIEVIVIDNGSVQKAAQRFLASLAKDGRFRVVSHPGAFNFSKMCNDAAADAKSETLIFLNNDTEIIDDSWLEPLLYWTQQPGIGAVGAKLLYPNGRVQHAGVVLGIDGRAGHFERLLKKNDPGYFGRLCVPHEVSSVTAACLAVDKRKFDAVGGFDAVNLPVELNDIDLCLRLWERGWKSICAADCVLIHRESASRGITLRANEVYGSERRYFRMRWMHRLRDDLYFHPALSLDSLAPALG